VDSATSSWAVPSRATPRHGVRRIAVQMRATPSGCTFTRRSPRQDRGSCSATSSEPSACVRCSPQRTLHSSWWTARSGGGKSTFAERLARLLDGTVVHSDDIAWHHDPIHWEDVLVGGVIAPWRRGEAVYFRRPPGWVAQGRPGALRSRRDPSSSSRALVLDGSALRLASSLSCGSSPTATRPAGAVCSATWCSAEHPRRRRRSGMSGMRAEEPFLADDRPWSRASLVVNGTPEGAMQADSVLAPGPLDA
jgi:hypothetical protein